MPRSGGFSLYRGFWAVPPMCLESTLDFAESDRRKPTSMARAPVLDGLDARGRKARG
jgi:hypothetical protein